MSKNLDKKLEQASEYLNHTKPWMSQIIQKKLDKETPKTYKIQK